MEIIIAIAIIAIIIYVLYLLVIHIIIPIVLPILGILLLITVSAGAIYGMFMSIKGFKDAFGENKDPYALYVDKSSKAPPGVKRNYFFGPGVYQFARIVKDAFVNTLSHQEKLTQIRDKYGTFYDGYSTWVNAFRRTKVVSVWIFFIAGFVFLYASALFWTLLFTMIMAFLSLAGISAFFIAFSILWLADRFMLWLKSIQSRCGLCKRFSIVPDFICSDCGMVHSYLSPGPYGVLNRQCPCGQRLPTTFFGGRSRLMSQCPHCSGELAASDARQFGIQIVGGTNAGKTTYSAAFFHEYIVMLNKLGVVYELFPEADFRKLEEEFQQGLSGATTETNAAMYSIVHTLSTKARYQLTLYDIAGESFGGRGYELQQQQFGYCEGLIFIIDPTAGPREIADGFMSFIMEYKSLASMHISMKTDVPVAVIISKADIYKKEIGLIKIKTRFTKNPTEFADTEGRHSLARTHNGVCREFLYNHGFSMVMNHIENNFTLTRYFAASAIGHEAASGYSFEPWGVIEPVHWLLAVGKADICNENGQLSY
ncbi:MAG: GTPase domain-containing protein [Defluviitaleaceae bacterium]|nr:GTPase domain-containing protein [Defluviitaleaceae bacterium]